MKCLIILITIIVCVTVYWSAYQVSEANRYYIHSGKCGETVTTYLLDKKTGSAWMQNTANPGIWLRDNKFSFTNEEILKYKPK